jgi:hypothetical protein
VGIDTLSFIQHIHHSLGISATHATNPEALPATAKGSTWAQLLLPAEQERLLHAFFTVLFVRVRAEAAEGGWFGSVMFVCVDYICVSRRWCLVSC